jgi:hypothetical protein
MLSLEAKARLREAFSTGKLKVASANPSGAIEWRRVLDVQRSAVSGEAIHELTTSSGSMILTGGHRVYVTPTVKREAESFREGDTLHTAHGPSGVISNKRIGAREWMYDLTAERWHNFTLQRSRVVVANSPDRNYHFRPPAHEETVNQYSRVFGYIWEDAELKEFLERALDAVIAAPPRTPFTNISELGRWRPEWRTLLLTGAANYALLALMINWIAEEFDYSIGGVSLNLDKSSKYEAAANNYKDLFESQLERAKQTIKIVKGLQQPRFGIGIRSSFGPYAGRGVLTPQKFVGF